MSVLFFYFYQVLILLVKGVLPLLTVSYLSTVMSDDLLATYFVVLSMANFTANFSQLNSSTMGANYFFKKIQSTKSEMDVAITFQFVRLAVAFVLTLLCFIYFIINDISLFYFSPLLFQLVVSFVPSWVYYSQRRLGVILLIELLPRLPVYLVLLTSYYYSFGYLYLFDCYLYISVCFLFLMVCFFIRFFLNKGSSFLFKCLFSSLEFIKEVTPYNLLITLFNSGYIFILSFVASEALIVQIGIAERIKNVLLQAQGVLLSERMTKNRYLVLDKNFNLLSLLKANAICLMLSFLLFLFVIFLVNENYIFNFMFSADKEYIIYYVLYLFTAPLVAVSCLCVSQFLITKKFIKALLPMSLISSCIGLCITAYSYFGNSSLTMITVPAVIEIVTISYVFLFFRGLR